MQQLQLSNEQRVRMRMITCGSRALLTASRALSLPCQTRFYYVRQTELDYVYVIRVCLCYFLLDDVR